MLTFEQAEETPLRQVRPLTQAEERHRERIQQAHHYFQQGWAQKDIAQQLHLNPKTIRRYLHGSPVQIRRQRNLRQLDRYKPYLLQR